LAPLPPLHGRCTGLIKFAIINELLTRGYERVFWMDDDAFFVNLSRPLFWLEILGQDQELIIARDMSLKGYSSINDGGTPCMLMLLVLRCTARTACTTLPHLFDVRVVYQWAILPCLGVTLHLRMSSCAVMLWKNTPWARYVLRLVWSAYNHPYWRMRSSVATWTHSCDQTILEQLVVLKDIPNARSQAAQLTAGTALIGSHVAITDHMQWNQWFGSAGFIRHLAGTQDATERRDVIAAAAKELGLA
jgi:hypothetical protein